MKVREIMQRKVTVVAEDDTLGLAQQLMAWNDVRHLPVVRAADRRLTGILSERDLLRAFQTQGTEAPERRVRDFMSSPAHHIHPEADVADAAADLSAKKLGCLPVVEVGALVGIVAVGDLLGMLAQYPTKPRKAGELDGSVASIMYPEPIAVHTGDTMISTAQRMIQAGVRHACVVDGDGVLLGILSDRDVRRVLGDPRRALGAGGLPEGIASVRVGDVMTREPRTLDQEDSIRAALDVLLSDRFGALPVVDARGRLRGIVSYVDVMRYLASRAA